MEGSFYMSGMRGHSSHRAHRDVSSRHEPELKKGTAARDATLPKSRSLFRFGSLREEVWAGTERCPVCLSCRSCKITPPFWMCIRDTVVQIRVRCCRLWSRPDPDASQGGPISDRGRSTKTKKIWKWLSETSMPSEQSATSAGGASCGNLRCCFSAAEMMPEGAFTSPRWIFRAA